MANTETIYLKGKAKWVRNTQPNEWGKWAMTLYPDPESLEKFRELQAQGLKNVIKKDDDGYNFSITRPTQKQYGNRIQGFAPPKVMDKDGQDLGNTRIGNGSDVTVKLEVYEHKTPTGKAKAARWEALRVDNLVPYEPPRDFSEDEANQTSGLMEQPEHLF